MAEARKCDRCGKYYDNNDRLLWLYNSRPSTGNGPLDLCDDCIADLMKWLDKGQRVKDISLEDVLKLKGLAND